MAFVTAANPLRNDRTLSLKPFVSSFPNAPALSNTPARTRATAVQPNRQTNSNKATPRPRTTAHVIDSRVACRHELHHWITVRNQSCRLFERAAVSQADVTRQLEQKGGPRSLHRWVLRQLPNYLENESSLQSQLVSSITQPVVSYVVMESFHQTDFDNASQSLTRRWLSAVERVGPLISTVDAQTLQYTDVFTCKTHDVVFDPHQNVVVLETLNFDSSHPHFINAVVNALRAKAERSVSVGDCLEFCVLQSTVQSNVFKTLEIYKNMDTLRRHMRDLDKKYMHAILSHTQGNRRNRQMFKPVLFS